MSILIQSSIMIFLLTSIIFFLMSKLVNITKFNIIIYVVLIGFWIASSFLKISIIHVGHPWQWPLIIATYQFTQVIFRLPLGKLSQKLKSRKIPLLLTVFIMVIFSIPLMITINTLTIFLAMFGLGFFGAGFGMQNQYWSENWHIKNVFITVGLIGITPYLGDYIGSIVKETVEINQNTIKYILMIFIIIIMLIVILYSTNKEKKETVMLDNKDKIASIINGFGLKNVLYMSIMISIISISISLVNNPFLVHKENLNDTLLIAISSKTASITISLFVTFFMIRFISVRKINLISHIIMIIGL
ncbi:MAG: hypothetical protein HRT99_03290 [Mycoplasmatales bacterium]|nr:hypothetical protein [Mycoplasmatales bacterium]